MLLIGLAWFLPKGLASDFSRFQGELAELGCGVWFNETGGDSDRLMWWNEGEDFLSLGIGHFIWYPEGRQGPFEQSFIGFLAFLAGEGKALPDGVVSDSSSACPWNSRSEFLAGRNGPKAAALLDFLEQTISEQAGFLLHRLKRFRQHVVSRLPPVRSARVLDQFTRLSESFEGRFALLDYVNFKGEGLIDAERYGGFGWGLLQVLEMMDSDEELDPLDEFAGAAMSVLERRVALAPAGRADERWLPGWRRRVLGYRRQRSSQEVQDALAVCRKALGNDRTAAVRSVSRSAAVHTIDDPSYPSGSSGGRRPDGETGR